MRYSASTQSKYIDAMIDRIKYALDKNSDMPVVVKYSLIQELQKIKRPKREKPNPVFLRPEEILLLIENAKPKLALIIELLFRTGARISEALSITIGSLKRINNHYRIKIMQKGSREHNIEITIELADKIIKEYNGTVYLFEKNNKPLNKSTISMQILRLSRKILGIDKGVCAHALRHSIATHLFKKTKNILKVQSLLGHANPSTTINLYIHDGITWDEKKEMLEGIFD